MTDEELNLRVATEVLGWKPRGDRTFDACLPDGGCIATVDFLRLVYPVAVRYAPEKPGLLNDIDVCDFRPATDANDDYAVLSFVREEWGIFKKRKMKFELQKVLLSYCESVDTSLCYRIGDYSRAAVACLERKT